MKEVQASVAKARFAELLDQVERGETVLITRHGRAVARLVPEEADRRREVDAAIAGIRILRRSAKPATSEEILAWRDEGRR